MPDKSLSQPIESHCLVDRRERFCSSEKRTIQRIWKIGGQVGWYYGTHVWRFRSYINRWIGGEDLLRGRRHPNELEPGDVIDFWRVVEADRTIGRLVLQTEITLPGQAWLAFEMQDNQLTQTVFFRPSSLWGHMYWWTVWPIHWVLFDGLHRRLAA